jgi:nucleotide-binding universal stress UspA family protein
MTIKRILVATDFGAASNAAIEYAVALAAHLAASVCVVHVVEPRHGGPATADGGVTGEARLHAAAERLRRSIPRVAGIPLGVDHDFRIGEPAAEIVACAREELADLIVLGTRAHHAGAHRTVQLVIERSPCPVILLPAVNGNEETHTNRGKSRRRRAGSPSVPTGPAARS